MLGGTWEECLLFCVSIQEGTLFTKLTLNLQTSFKKEGGHFHKAAVLQTNTTLLLSVFSIAIACSKVRFKFDD